MFSRVLKYIYQISLYRFAVPYRACVRIKNLRDSQGNHLKTVCSIDFSNVGHTWNRRQCESYGMNMFKASTPELEIALLEYAGDQYQRHLPGFIFYDGEFGNNWCRSVSNVKTGIATIYKKHYNPCSDACFAMCEIKRPRSK